MLGRSHALSGVVTGSAAGSIVMHLHPGPSAANVPNIICASCGEPARHHRRGLCAPCFKQHKAAGTLDAFPVKPPINVADRLLLAKRGPDECWPWLWRTSVRGYGTLVVAKVEYKAHRLAYEHWIGPVPDGMVVDHICHNIDPGCAGGKTCLHRRCVNPAHLEPVTAGTNTLRGKNNAAVNLRKTHCSKGHEYTPENTRTPPSGGRYCIKCDGAKGREWKRKKRAEQRAKREAAA